MKIDEIFNVADFGWGTQGFSLVKRYYNDAASLLDEHFKTIRSLTYHNFAGQTVDTEPFRMAVWYYVHRVCGVFHDDFDYARVNQLIHQKTKSYVKKVALEPFTITSSDMNLGMQFMPEEKAHISFLAAESRKQASVLYCLRAVSKYLSTK
jgi:sestrin